MNAKKNMEEAVRLLRDVKESGYWPFASPAPCSTEVKIKASIFKAIESIDDALYWHDRMFGNGRDDMSAPSFQIVQVK